MKYEHGYEPFLMLKPPIIAYDEIFVGYGQNKVSHVYELSAARYRLLVSPTVFLVHHHRDKTIGVSAQESAEIANVKDFTLGAPRRFARPLAPRCAHIPRTPCVRTGWSCWRQFQDRVERDYGWRSRDPCWAAGYVLPKTNQKRGAYCVRNNYKRWMDRPDTRLLEPKE